jgi:hypothetical protein
MHTAYSDPHIAEPQSIAYRYPDDRGAYTRSKVDARYEKYMQVSSIRRYRTILQR